MKYLAPFLLLFLISSEVFCQHVSSPDSVLTWLKTGNKEFVHGEFNVHGVDSSLRIGLSKEQHPKAVILTCSDSRVSPELIFDKGLGDLFVIRIAGNIADDAVVGSIEYAVEHLHTPLVVVMGHKNCGAIGAAVADLQKPENEINNHIRVLTDKIELAIATEKLNEKDFTQKALLSNIIFTVSSLNQSRPVLSEAVKKGELKVVGAVYDLASGKVEWLKPATMATQH
ncbi:carbonic anhydrase [Solitalea longa]|uniref:Carbonic anhydrase n=1 Tax=Solitalea longa TaxID=2079460 RepID=A0A2S5A440_9SPHI|nr:carbonic anhydrase [Solitalea longa]POY37351.1 carbonic anhydrase [Solitalea longa]